MSDYDVSIFWEKVGAAAPCGKRDCKSSSTQVRCGVQGCTGVSGDPQLSRSRVPGGWALLSRTGGMVMVPDKDGEWTIGNPIPLPAPQILTETSPSVAAAPAPPPFAAPLAPMLKPSPTQNDADLLPDVDPNIVAADFAPIGQVGQGDGIVEDMRDDSVAPIGDGFSEGEPQVSMEELKAKVAAKASGAPLLPTAAPEDSKSVLVNRDHLDALQATMAAMGAWVTEEYEHVSTEPRKLWKEVMISLAAVIPEG